MGVRVTTCEGAALYALLAEDEDDIVLKTDSQGFIVHATRAIEQLGISLPHLLFGPHLADLVHPGFTAEMRGLVAAALRGRNDRSWIEFPARRCDGELHWYQLQLRPLVDRKGRGYGALGILRCVNELRRLEDELFEAALTDELTGLTNRKAFTAMLDHLAGEGAPGSVALFDIDNFKAVNLRYGQAAGDEVLVAFADLLRSFLSSNEIISRIGGETFAVLLPQADAGEAEELCRRVIEVLAEIDRSGGPGAFAFTASMGVARIERSLDETMKRAELALFMAKAKGRARVESHETSLPVRRQARRIGQPAARPMVGVARSA